MATTGMFTVLEAAAASSADLASGQVWDFDANPRIITAIGLVGSTNPGDAAVEVRVGGNIAIKHYNTTGGANLVPKDLNDIIPVNIPVPGGARIQVPIVDAGAGNVLAFTIRIQPMPVRRAMPMRGRGGFRRGRRF